MEVLPTPAGQDPSAGGAGRPLDASEELDWRLAGFETRLDAISERLGRIEGSLREAVAEEVQAATADLRRALTELGRRLVKDLPQELARHRDAIVSELRPPAPPPPPPPPEVAEAEAEPEPEPEPEPVPVPEPEPVPEAETDAATVASTPEAADQRRPSRRRRRHG